MNNLSKVKNRIHRRGRGFLQATRRFMILSAGISLLVQLYFTENLTDIAAVSLMFVGSVCLSTRLRGRLFHVAPLSNLMVVGTGATFLYLPLVLNTLIFEGAVRGLKEPLLTVGYSLVFFICMTLAHYLYTESIFLSSVRSSLQRALARGHVFDTPTGGHLWAMGLVGVASTFLVRFGAGESGGFLVKLVSGFAYLSFAPLIAFVAPLMRGRFRVTGQTAVAVLIYVICLFAIAMSSGNRSYFILGFVNLGLAYFVAWGLGYMRFPKFNPVTLALVLVAGLIVYKPLMYTFTAAQAATERDRAVSFRARFDKFLKILADPEFVETYKMVVKRDRERMESQGVLMWNETYFENEFFNRVVNLKYHDMLLGCVAGFDDTQIDRLKSISSRRILCILPGPVLSLFNVGFDKTDILSSSMGDYIWDEATRNGYSLRAFRTGSLHADAYLHFRWIYGLPLALMAVPVFVVSDSLVRPARTGGRVLNKFSTLGLLSMLSIFTTFGSASGVESISSIVLLATRGVLQDTIIYMVVFQIVSPLVGSNSKSPGKRRLREPENPAVEDL